MSTFQQQVQQVALLVAIALMGGCAMTQREPKPLLGVHCSMLPPQHCPDKDCPGPVMISQGDVVEPMTGRTFFLDYPCDWRPGEKVTFVLSLHGAGSYGNWQRHYFPLMDFKDKYHLVIATPNSPTRFWTEADDLYLQNIVNMVYGAVGRENIKAFWLVGHSQGGMTSNRLLRTDFFKERVDGWLSLSGGRLGPTPMLAADFFPAAASGGLPAVPGLPAGGGAGRRLPPGPRDLPPADFSFIFATGAHEFADQPMPAESPWATKYHCGARVRLADVVDTRPGYVYDPTRQNPGSKAWGHEPRPGVAEVFQYPHCERGRVVADLIRLDKGHTEGLEPNVTERLITLMLSARKR